MLCFNQLFVQQLILKHDRWCLWHCLCWCLLLLMLLMLMLMLMLVFASAGSGRLVLVALLGQPCVPPPQPSLQSSSLSSLSSFSKPSTVQSSIIIKIKNQIYWKKLIFWKICSALCVYYTVCNMHLLSSTVHFVQSTLCSALCAVHFVQCTCTTVVCTVCTCASHRVKPGLVAANRICRRSMARCTFAYFIRSDYMMIQNTQSDCQLFSVL